VALRSLFLALAVSLSAGVARADELPDAAVDALPPAVDALPPAVDALPPPAVAPPAPNPLDFNLLDEKPKESPEQKQKAAAIERQVKLRRSLLWWHQAVGLATLGALIATAVVGQLVYDDKYGGGDDTGNLNSTHLVLAIGTSALFAATGILALIAPNPYPKPVKLDSALMHKLAMLAATIGMVAEIVIGPITSAREGSLDQRQWAVAHLVSGWATLGFMALGSLALVF
jgi:hypothetical protein